MFSTIDTAKETLHRFLLFSKPGLNSSGEDLRSTKSKALRRWWLLSLSIKHLQKLFWTDSLPGPNCSIWANSYFQQLYTKPWPSEAPTRHCCLPEAGVPWAAPAVAQCLLYAVSKGKPLPQPSFFLLWQKLLCCAVNWHSWKITQEKWLVTC